MIDMHAHILPQIDDGASSLEEAVAMARIACADGVSVMAATPHGPGRSITESLRRRDIALEQLRRTLEHENIPLRLVPGMEFMATDNVIELANDHPSGFYGGSELQTRLLLLELFPSYDLRSCGDILFQAQLKNIRLILAHPERYQDFMRRLDVLENLLDKGIILQFNAASLAPGWLNRRRKNAILRLIHHSPGQVVLGSDAHDTERRSPILSTARKTIIDKLGQEVWRQANAFLDTFNP
jgi:protein-tyrosine phosphatase